MNNAKEPYYMTFYKDISLLHSIHNQQSLFFAEMIARMDSNNIVSLTPNVRKKIIAAIGSKTEDPLATARQLLSKLVKVELIASQGGGDYMVNPKIHGHSNLRQKINDKSEVFLKIKYTDEGRLLAVGEDSDEVIVETEEPCSDPVIVKKELTPVPPKAPDCVNFDEFWYIYPKKVGKKTAVKVWLKIKPNKEAFQRIADHLATAFKDTDKQFIPNPTTYLNGERWNDEVISSKPVDPFNTEIPSFERRCENTFDAFSGNTYDGELNS